MAELRRTIDSSASNGSSGSGSPGRGGATPSPGSSSEFSFQPLTMTGQRVLVVDDEEYVRGIVRTMLEDLGFEAVEACDGDEGLRAFDEAGGEFAACVVDLTMPGMAGLELLELIRERSLTVPVMLVSGYSRHEVRQREAQSKNISFLQKPFTMAQFKTAIDTHLNVA